MRSVRMATRLAATIISALLAAASPAHAAPLPFVAATHLVAEHPSTIIVDNAILNWKTFIVMPGVDFQPTNGSCYAHLHLSNGYAPNFVWDCRDLSAPIVFSSTAVAPADLVPDSLHTWGTGYVGLVGTGGVSHGAWTLSSPPAKFDYQPASTL